MGQKALQVWTSLTDISVKRWPKLSNLVLHFSVLLLKITQICGLSKRYWHFSDTTDTMKWRIQSAALVSVRISPTGKNRVDIIKPRWTVHNYCQHVFDESLLPEIPARCHQPVRRPCSRTARRLKLPSVGHTRDVRTSRSLSIRTCGLE